MRRLALPKGAVEIRFLTTPEDMRQVEEVQRVVWPGSETDVVPMHLLITLAHNGGVALGAFPVRPDGTQGPLVGFVYGFPGLYETPSGWQVKHCSHQLGIVPAWRNQGLAYWLKRAQWQAVRHQGLELITWTYDPLLSRNAHLNIHKLGAVCHTYLREVYGEMRDGLNVGLPSDRFQVELWVRSPRVEIRLSAEPRKSLDLAHFLAAGAKIVNSTRLRPDGWPEPPDLEPQQATLDPAVHPLLLVEIPWDFLALKAADQALALRWRQHTRAWFEALFAQGYWVTDFVRLPGSQPRSFYVLSYGESTLGSPPSDHQRSRTPTEPA